MRRRVVITGLGAITPLGNTVEENWKNAMAGKNGIDYIKGYNSDLTDIKIAGEVKDFDFVEFFGRKQVKRLDKFVQFGMIASKEAIEDSGLDFDKIDRDRMGVYYGSGIGGLETIAEQEDKAKARGYDRLSPLDRRAHV